MERTKGVIMTNERKLLTMASALVSRANLAMSLGQQQYGGDRDVYQALGYPLAIKFSDYAARYTRQDIAKAVIDRPAKATWEGELNLQEPTTAEDTELETEWVTLRKEFKLQNVFNRVDRLSGIGCYGVLLFGMDDIKSKEDWSKPVTSGKRKLLYLKPFGQGSALISDYVKNVKDPRYGHPLFYEIKITEPSADGTSTGVSETIKVHYSRILHVVDDILESDIIGIPKLEAIFNRLIDLEKLVGGDAEMFWRGARPGYQGIVDKDFMMTPEVKEDLKVQVDEFEHNLRRLLINEGIEYKSLDQQIAEPGNHVDIQIQMISAVTGIPKRILTGTERGELSSGQDSNEWKVYVQNRRTDHAETHIVKPFIDICIKYGILPAPSASEDYEIMWSDLFASSEKERVDIGRSRSEALRNYATTPLAEAIVPPTAFMEFFLGLKPSQIDLVKTIVGDDIDEEVSSIMEEDRKMKQEMIRTKNQAVTSTKSEKGIKQAVRRK